VSRPAVYTVGSGTRTLEEFLDLLRLLGIELLVDVRHFPGSRRFPHFGREALAAALADAGIGYVWLGEDLGGYRPGGYERHMETQAFERGLTRLEDLARAHTVAVMCAERLPWRCHRRFIADRLVARGWNVVHAIDARHAWRPREWGEPSGTLSLEEARKTHFARGIPGKEGMPKP